MAAEDNYVHPYDDQSDKELVALIKHGTRTQRNEACAVFHHRYSRDIWRYIQSKGVSRDESADILQDVWLIACQKISDFEWRDKPVKAWLITIARNKVREYFRKTPDEVSLEQISDILWAGLQLDDASP